MKVSILSVGKMKDDAGFKKMETFYLSRIKQYNPVSLISLKEKRTRQEETEMLQKHIPAGNLIVALREEGKKMNSLDFSSFLSKNRDNSKDVTFVIGGAYGYDNIGEHIALSIAQWTLPHQLAKIIILEQIYRGFSILSGSKYHHG